MKRASSWSDREMAILHVHYPQGGTEAVLERIPHRTADAVRSMARRAGMALRARRGAVYDLRPWSNAELRTLREVFPVHGLDGAHRLLSHRSRLELDEKAKALGLQEGTP